MQPFSIDDDATIHATPDAVYAALADATTRVTWMAELETVDAPPRPLQPGDRFDGRARLLLHEFVGQSEVLAAEPAQGLTERVVIGARFVSEWTLDDAGEGRTRVRHRVEIEFPEGVFGRLERWVLGRRLRQLQRESLRRLAELIDAAG